MSCESDIEKPSQSLPELILASQGFALTVEEQPKQKFRFRYKSDQTRTHGVLHGDKSIRNNTFPKVKLITPTQKQEEEDFVVTISLYHDDENGEKIASPHLLKEKANKDTYGPICQSMNKKENNKFILELTDCYIEFTKKGADTESSLSKQEEELTKNWPDTPRKFKSIKGNNPQYAYLGFNAFKKNADNTFTHVCGPVYSQKVTNQICAFGILKLCNKYVNSEGGDEITIVLTTPPQNKNFKVQIYEIDEKTHNNIWEIEVKPEFVNKEVICFTAPTYRRKLSHKEGINDVKCHIGILGASCAFYYEFRYHMTQISGSKRQNEEDISLCAETPNRLRRMEHVEHDGYDGIQSQFDMCELNSHYSPDFALRNYKNSFHPVSLPINPFGISQPFKSNSINGFGHLQMEIRQQFQISNGRNMERDKRKVIFSDAEYLNYLERILIDYETFFSDKSLRNEIDRLNGDYSSKHENGNTIFHAMIESNFNMFRQLLSLKPLHILLRGAINNNGETLLHYACAQNKPECIVPLLKLNLKLSLKDNSRRTALHIAIEKQHDNCIDRFIEILCQSDNYPNAIDDLKELFNIHDTAGYTVMHLAVQKNQKDLLEEMLKFCQKYEINPCSIQTLSSGHTIAHLAVPKELSGLMKLITKYVPDACFYNNYAGISATDMMETEDWTEMV